MPTASRPISSAASNEDPKSGVRKATIQGGLVAAPRIPPAPPLPKLQSAEIPKDIPSRSGRAAVRPRPSARTAAPKPAQVAAAVAAPPVPKAGLFRSLTTTREDWPIAPPVSEMAPSDPASSAAASQEEEEERRSDSQPPPTFGRHPRKGTLDPARQSLPAFRPPSLMIPVAPGPITIQAANDAEASPIPLPRILLPSALEPVSSDISVDFDELAPGSSLDHLPTGVQNRRLGSIILFAVGVGTGVVLTLLGQALS